MTLRDALRKLSASPTNPQPTTAPRAFDVAELYSGPARAAAAVSDQVALDEKLRKAYFWIVNTAIISPHYDIEYNAAPPQSFVVGDTRGKLVLPTAQSYSSFVLLPLLTFATRRKCLFVGGPGRGKTASAILMGVLAGYPVREVRRAMQHGHPQMTIADLLGNPLPADLVSAQSMEAIRIAWRGWLALRVKIIDEYNRIPTRTQSALLTVMGDNYAEVLDHIFECPESAWFLTANDEQGGGTYQVIEALRDRIDVVCGFCAYDRRRSQRRASASEALAMQLGAALAAHRAHTGQPVLLSFLGGEPSLWAPLPRVAEQLQARHALPLSITTNGTRLERGSLQALLLACFSEVTVSMDALGPAHDALRGWPGGAQALARGIEALAASKQRSGAGLLLRANIVLMRQTVGELRALCHALARWGVQELTFNALGGRDRPEFYPDHALAPEQIEALASELPALRAELAALGVVLHGSTDYVARMRASAEHRRLPVLDCAPGSRFLFVDEQGRASPCSFTLTEPGYALPLPATGPTAIGLLGRALVAGRAVRRSPACDDCHSTQVFGKYRSG